MNSIKDKIINGTLWTFVGKIGTGGLGFVVGIIMARLLLPSDFGYVVTISSFTGIAGYFASGGMGNALVRARGLKSSDYSTVFIAQFGICSLIYLFFYTVAPHFAAWFNDPIYEPLLRVAALGFFIRPFKNVASSKISREMRFKALSAISVGTALMSGSCGIYLAFAGYGPWALILSGLLGGLISAPITMYLARWFPRMKLDFIRLKNLANTGVKFSMNDIIDYLRLQAPNIFISYFIGPAATGLYNRAHSLSQLPIELTSGSTYQVLFRGLAKVGSDEEAKALFMRSIAILALYSTPIYVGIWWLADPFIPLLYGEKWQFSADIIEILAINGIYTIGPACGAAIAARGALGIAFAIKIEALIILVLGLYFVAEYGILAAAITIVVVRLYLNIRMFGLVRKTLQLSWKELLHALSPAYLVSVILFIAFAGCHALLPETLSTAKPWAYFGMMALSSTSATLLVIALLPIPTIRGEFLRWISWAKKIPALHIN